MDFMYFAFLMIAMIVQMATMDGVVTEQCAKLSAQIAKLEKVG